MIKVYFVHEFIHDLDGFVNYLRISDEFKSQLVRDADNPDFLFASEWIYFKKHAFKEFKRLWGKAKVRVMYAGEAIEPDFNLFDYVIGFPSTTISKHIFEYESSSSAIIIKSIF